MNWASLFENDEVKRGEIVEVYVRRNPQRVPQPMIRAHSVVHKLLICEDGSVKCVDSRLQYSRPSVFFTSKFPRLSKKHSWLDNCYINGKTVRKIRSNLQVCI